MTYEEVLNYALEQAHQFSYLMPNALANKVDEQIAKRFPDVPDAWVSKAREEAAELLEG
jgi:hypothetical protein